jgi:hypothetical protein
METTYTDIKILSIGVPAPVRAYLADKPSRFMNFSKDLFQRTLDFMQNRLMWRGSCQGSFR